MSSPDEAEKNDEASEFAAMFKAQVQEPYAKICSACIDAAINKYGFSGIIKDLQKALEAGHKRRTYNARGGR